MIKFLLLLIILTINTPIQAQDVYPQNNKTVFSADALHRLYIVGLQYLNSGDLTQAEIAFRSIIAFPQRNKDWRTIRYYQGKAHVYLGDVYFSQKKYDRSVEQYQTVAQEYAEIEEYSIALYKLGRSLILNKQEAQGIEILKDYNYNYGTKDRVADNSLYWIAQGYIGLKNYTSALTILHQILRDFPDSGMAYDVRILATKLETSLSTPTAINQQELQHNRSKNHAFTENLSNEKELIDRVKQLLSIKENLLKVKEKKLVLLESVSQTRSKTLKEKDISVPQ